MSWVLSISCRTLRACRVGNPACRKRAMTSCCRARQIWPSTTRFRASLRRSNSSALSTAETILRLRSTQRTHQRAGDHPESKSEKADISLIVQLEAALFPVQATQLRAQRIDIRLGLGERQLPLRRQPLAGLVA